MTRVKDYRLIFDKNGTGMTTAQLHLLMKKDGCDAVIVINNSNNNIMTRAIIFLCFTLMATTSHALPRIVFSTYLGGNAHDDHLRRAIQWFGEAGWSYMIEYSESAAPPLQWNPHPAIPTYSASVL